MRIYFHHNQNLNYIWRQWEQGKFPSHLLYGATHLSRFGIDVILHQFTNQEGHAYHVLSIPSSR